MCLGAGFPLSFYFLEFVLKDLFFQKKTGLTHVTWHHLSNLLGFDFYLTTALMGGFVVCFFLFFLVS